MTMLACRQNMYKITGATDYYDNSTLQNSDVQIHKFATAMAEADIFKRQNVRVKVWENDASRLSEFNDLLGSGIAAISAGTILSKYKARARCNWNDSTAYGEELGVFGGDSDEDMEE